MFSMKVPDTGVGTNMFSMKVPDTGVGTNMFTMKVFNDKGWAVVGD